MSVCLLDTTAPAIRHPGYGLPKVRYGRKPLLRLVPLPLRRILPRTLTASFKLTRFLALSALIFALLAYSGCTAL